MCALGLRMQVYPVAHYGSTGAALYGINDFSAIVYVPVTTPIAANLATPPPPPARRPDQPGMPLLVVVASGQESAPNVWPAARSIIVSIARVVAGVQYCLDTIAGTESLPAAG